MHIGSGGGSGRKIRKKLQPKFPTWRLKPPSNDFMPTKYLLFFGRNILHFICQRWDITLFYGTLQNPTHVDLTIGFYPAPAHYQGLYYYISKGSKII